MRYPNYIIHFNKNHDHKNGQFASGDGDGDGVADDHHNSLSKSLSRYSGKNAEKNIKKDGYKKASSAIVSEYEKKYGTGTGKYLNEYLKKYNKVYKEAYKKVMDEINLNKLKINTSNYGYEFDKRMEKVLSDMGMTGDKMSVAILMDLGYDEIGAEFVSKVMNDLKSYNN